MSAVRSERAPMLRTDHPDPSMNLPQGKTRGDCARFRRCNAFCGHIAADEVCDWVPSRFEPNITLLNHQARYGRELSERLEALMRRCREDHHTPSYQDLLEVQGQA
jgi:hypothetical protein